MKRVFLTGASSGIGRALAELLSAKGFEVWGTSRSAARLPKLSLFHPVVLDLNDAASVREGFRAALAEAGNFDVLINNAGGGHFGPAETLPPEILEQQFRTLVFAQIELCQMAVASMRSQNGLIINVTSLASRLPVPFMSAYNAAKAAMASFTMSLQLELSDRKIRIVDLQPADIRTEFNQTVQRSAAAGGGADERAERVWCAAEHNMRTAPEPALVAERVVQVIESPEPAPRVTVGGFFQAQIAPLINRFLPQSVRLWGLKKYYRI